MHILFNLLIIMLKTSILPIIIGIFKKEHLISMYVCSVYAKNLNICNYFSQLPSLACTSATITGMACNNLILGRDIVQYTMQLQIFAQRKFSALLPGALIGKSFVLWIFFSMLMITQNLYYMHMGKNVTYDMGL